MNPVSQGRQRDLSIFSCLLSIFLGHLSTVHVHYFLSLLSCHTVCIDRYCCSKVVARFVSHTPPYLSSPPRRFVQVIRLLVLATGTLAPFLYFCTHIIYDVNWLCRGLSVVFTRIYPIALLSSAISLGFTQLAGISDFVYSHSLTHLKLYYY